MIHLYTGEGKGKTTAAIGLAIRHIGAGGSVAFVQFLKSSPSGELLVLDSLPQITVLRNTEKHGFFIQMTDAQKRLVTSSHNENLSKACALIANKSITMLVLDELCAAYTLNLIDRTAVDALLLDHGPVELILTGRNPDQKLQDAADYITEMNPIRHPYGKGILARKGVEY